MGGGFLVPGGISLSTATNETEDIQNETNSDEPREVIIIGSGPAGYTAAIYTARANLTPLLFSGYAAGGQLTTTTEVENFPGFPEGIDGTMLVNSMREQAERFGAEMVDKDVESVDASAEPIKVVVEGVSYYTRTLIIATGAEAIWLGAEDETKYRGRGLSACATCDGAFFRDQEIVVVGGGDSAMEEAMFLTRFAKKVTIIHRREGLRASKVMADRAKANPKIEWKLSNTVKRWLGDETGLTGAILESTVDGSEQVIECTGGFMGIGHRPNTEFLSGQIETDEKGYIRIGFDDIAKTATSVRGVFTAGDVADSHYQQAITAAAMGCQAAIDVEQYLEI